MVMPTATEAEELESARAEFTEAYRRHNLALVRRFYLVVRHDAEDIVSEAWARAWMFRANWRRECGLKGWVNTIGMNIARERWKHARRHPAETGPESENAIFSVPDRQSSIDGRIDAAALAPHVPQLLQMRHLEGMSWEEIAARLTEETGHPVSTNYSRVIAYRARQAFLLKFHKQLR